jgi:peroxiredoxin
VLVIGGGKQTDADKIARRFKLPFPVLADPDRAVYLSYGLDKAMWLIQRSASLLVNKQGIVTYFHKVTNPNDSVNKDELMQAITRLK